MKHFLFLSSQCIFAHRYAANVEKIDYDDEKVLIHYRQWSHRYDEWFDWTSPYLRPMERERVQLRREGLQEDNFIPVSHRWVPKRVLNSNWISHVNNLFLFQGFHVNEKVLASWSDCRFYPAKVLAVNKDGKLRCYDSFINIIFKCKCYVLHEMLMWFIIKQNCPTASYTVKFYDGVVQTVKGIHVKPFIREVHFAFSISVLFTLCLLILLILLSLQIEKKEIT